MKYNILHLTPDFNYADGRSYYVYLILKYLNRRGHNVILATNAGDSFDRVDELGIPVFKYNSLSRKSAFAKSLKTLADTVTENNIQIVHTYHRYFELLAASLAHSKKIRTVSTALSIVKNRYFVEYKSEKIIAVSNSVRDLLINKFNVKSRKISLIPNFVDSEDANTAESVKSGSGGQTTLLAVGRFHKDKSFETILMAMNLLKGYRIKLLLVGEGKEKSKYEKIIKLHSLNAEIFPPQRNLKEFFDAADICILTSVRDPLPGFMLQSGLFGKPFIGSDVDGISEVIENLKNGLLFEKRNPEDLAEKIKIFINEPTTREECALELNKLILDKYTEKSVIGQIEKLYQKLLE